MSNIYNMTDTWNAGGTAFTAILMNVTDTASAAGSKLLDLQKSGTSYFNVDKLGNVSFLASAAASLLSPTTALGGNFSTGEILLTNNAAAGQNTLALLNQNVAGISAFTLRGSDFREHLAIGWNNPSSTYNGGGTFTFLEISDFDSGANASFTASITTNQLTVTGTPTGRALAVGQVIAGAGIPFGTNITALGTGAGGAGTYTINTSLTVSSEAMTAGWPVPTFYINRSGYVGGAYTTQQSVIIGNSMGGEPEGMWSWKNITAGSPSSVYAFQIDPTNNYVNVPNSIVIGAQARVAPVAAALLDGYGQAIFGNVSSGRSAIVGAGFLINTLQATANQMRLVNNNVGKVDFLVNATPVRLDIRDTDNSNAIPLSIDLNGVGGINVGATKAIPAGGTAGLGVRVSSTSNFGMFFGSGAPSLAAAKGSIYLRSNGSTTNDRAYINTDGSTTWTALITAA